MSSSYLWLGSAWIASELSRRKGYGERIGLGTGLILSAIGLLLWLAIPLRAASEASRSREARRGGIARRRRWNSLRRRAIRSGPMAEMSVTGAPRTRDAQRSRAAILDAAEELFARDGFDATSLAEIGDAAGVSRGTPSYFFGSKEELYVAVLERLYALRNEALEPAFAPLAAWALAKAPSEPLEAVLTRSVDGYLRFLHGRPSFVDIFEREALAGGDRLRRFNEQSTVIEDAFATLKRRARARGLKPFDVDHAVMTFVSLCVLPVAHRNTMLRRHGVSVDDRRFLTARRKQIVDLMLRVFRAA
jgi:TetR/AcrR family transcriptional regulator